LLDRIVIRDGYEFTPFLNEQQVSSAENAIGVRPKEPGGDQWALYVWKKKRNITGFRCVIIDANIERTVDPSGFDSKGDRHLRISGKVQADLPPTVIGWLDRNDHDLLVRTLGVVGWGRSRYPACQQEGSNC